MLQPLLMEDLVEAERYLEKERRREGSELEASEEDDSSDVPRIIGVAA